MKKQRYISFFCFALFFFLLYCNRSSKEQKALEKEKDQIGPLGTFGMS
ncbi:hypothetical protein [Pseudogracilibacillus sp. ICA-222130]